MTKTYVVDEEKDSKIPFLRGMLIKSLQRSGLEFVEAYKLASDIRDDLDDLEVITTEELRERIIEALEEDYPDIVLSRYQKEIIYTEFIEVIGDDGHAEPFSRGVFVQRLMNCGIPIPVCNSITRAIHSKLIRDKVKKITTDALISLSYQVTREKSEQKFADEYLVWCDYYRSNKPLIILIGGAPGSGKSTVATELANRLAVIRTQSTDMLREVMRSLIPKRVSPSLHTSSFNAGKLLHRSAFYQANETDALISGFQMQSDMVSVACEAVLRRAISEGVSMILEGVHMRPKLFQKMAKSDAIVVPVVLSVLDRQRLQRNFKGRSNQVEQRTAKRYLNHFEQIWQLQSLILSDADAADIEIVDNVGRDETITEICKIVTETIASGYRGKLSELRLKYGVAP